MNDGVALCAGECSHSFRSPVPVPVQFKQGLKGQFPVILSIATCCNRHSSRFPATAAAHAPPLPPVAHRGRGAHNRGGILPEISDRGPRGKGWTTQNCDVRAVAADLHHLVANLANQLRRHTMRRQMQQREAWHGFTEVQACSEAWMWQRHATCGQRKGTTVPRSLAELCMPP